MERNSRNITKLTISGIMKKQKQERKGFRSMIARSFIKSIESNQFNQIPFYQKKIIRLILSNQFDQMNFIKYSLSKKTLSNKLYQINFIK